MFANIDGEDETTPNTLGKELLDIDGVKGVVFSTANVSKFNDMISTMNLVTYILIISAAALSFVVLYNLTNVNISERIREIATIKVLGFYDGEVANYVYRENLIITFIGAFFGLFLGMALHNYIMLTVEMDNVMFGNAVKPITFVLSYVITVLFSLVVNAAMYGKLKKVPMVESLKAVE
jgi:putative ABC transport system permease protein